MQSIVDRIGEAAQAVRAHPAFQSWIKDNSPEPGDAVQVNNSFMYRAGIKTNKSDLYLYLSTDLDGKLEPVPRVALGAGQNSDFRVVSAKSKNYPDLAALADAIPDQVAGLGTLLFILIGTVEDDVVVEQPVNHALLDHIILEPTAKVLVRLNGQTVVVRDTFDEEAIWTELKDDLEGDPDDIEACRNALGVAIRKLQEKSYARLILPVSGTEDASRSVIRDVTQVLAEQRDIYRSALERSHGTADVDRQAYNELLRISYNFSSDAIALIRLVVSLCDLKPIVLWCTLEAHHALVEAFRALPWVRTGRKPSLASYSATIGDARNSAFHDLFPFRKTLEVNLGDRGLEDVSLRIFSEFRNRKENKLSFRDKELVEVLTEFTRAAQRRVPPRFWRQNLNVMNATIKLFERTESAVDLLLEASSKGTA